jgi:type III restriction enzyme
LEQVIIENPVINAPFNEPERHFQFTEDGITNEIVESRRVSSYFIPVPRPKKRSKQQQLTFATEWKEDRIKENEFINKIRTRIARWRQGGYPEITRSSFRLLEYWRRSEREPGLFFCQIEALETLIYIAEVAKRYGDTWIENELRKANEDANPLLYRIAFKMATGSGKTVVMAMLIAWHVLNKNANKQDARFSDTFLIVTPGITIRDRLRVLLPNDLQNYYRKMDIVPPDLISQLGKAKIIITNFHAFKLRERNKSSKLTKTILAGGEASPFTETPAQMVRRVCRELGNKKNILVVNDEAHHCYRRKPESPEEKLKGDEKKRLKKGRRPHVYGFQGWRQ